MTKLKKPLTQEQLYERRLCNILAEYNLSFEELQYIAKSELLKLRNFGKGMFVYVSNKMCDAGLKFGTSTIDYYLRTRYNRELDLRQSYDNACNAYLKAFCKMYDMQYDEDAWVAREVGTIASIADYFFDFQDIKLCVDKKVKWEDLIEWYDYNLDAHTIGLNTINLNSWLMGCPRTSNEKMAEIFSIRRNLEKLIEKEK